MHLFVLVGCLASELQQALNQEQLYVLCGAFQRRATFALGPLLCGEAEAIRALQLSL